MTMWWGASLQMAPRHYLLVRTTLAQSTASTTHSPPAGNVRKMNCDPTTFGRVQDKDDR